MHVQDEKAYIAGERAGLLRAFRETLPAQRTLGELASGLSRMQIQMDNDRLHARQATTTVAELSAKLQVCYLDAIRKTHLLIPAFIKEMEGHT